MSNKDQTTRQDNCMSGLMAYDGGVVEMSTTDIWVLCENPDCTNARCRGIFAGDESYDDVSARAMRIRSTADLKKHAGGNSATELRCIVTPKNSFKDNRPAPTAFRKGTLPSGAHRGGISLDQAGNGLKFPVKKRARAWMTQTLSDLKAQPFESADSFARRKSIVAERISRLIAKNGIDSVKDAMPTSNSKSLTLSLQAANKSLADVRNTRKVGGVSHAPDRNSDSTLAQPVKAKHMAKPSRALFDVAPLQGEVVGERFVVKMDSGHFAYRFLDRGLGLVNSSFDDTVNKLRPAELRALETVVNNIVSEAVFTHSLDTTKAGDRDYKAPSVLSEAKRVATSRHQAQEATACEVRAPHPTDPTQDLIFLLEVSKAVTLKNGQRRFVVSPKTCIGVGKDTASDERRSFGDRNVNLDQQAEFEHALQQTLNISRSAGA